MREVTSLMLRWFALSFCILLLLAESAAAQRISAQQNRELRAVVRELTREAQEKQATGPGAAAEPDFASRYEGDLETQTLHHALRTRQHRDPFIDAYIRWQLLSFDPPLPELDDRAFTRLLGELPALLENPRGSREVMDLAARAVEAGPLSRSDFEQLQEYDAQISERTAYVERMNQPAMALRAWVREGVQDSPMRTVQSLLEECAARIDAGWPPRAVKTELSRRFSAAASVLSDDEKNVLADQTRRLVGRQRRFVNTITFFADRSVGISYSTAQVTQRDFDNWMQRLAGAE
jgi:hypothetical protein